MITSPSSAPRSRWRDRRVIVALVIVLLIVAAVAALAAAWWFFFGSEAPPAPTIDDALRVLLASPSASPSG